MNKINILASIVLFGLFFAQADLYARDGSIIGMVSEVNTATGEITVHAGGAGDKIRMGKKLYVIIEGRAVVMTATFPMQTVAKCRLIPAHAGMLKSISRDMIVYTYGKEAGTPDSSIRINGFWIANGDDSCNRVVFKITGDVITAFQSCPSAGVGNPTAAGWVLFRGKINGRIFSARYNPDPSRDNPDSIQVGDIQGKISTDNKSIEIWGTLKLWDGMDPDAYRALRAKKAETEKIRRRYVRSKADDNKGYPMIFTL